ncbi:hypothetical protein LIER_32082 [Lithospermum erythrorhizon]|uniref:X8 domain-containing protein n=1 Tax=Lithospermum erythrorhizon TaxID=34254 RepID=A0AAV3RTN5_LITER
MVVLFLYSILMLAIVGHSNAAYCVCKTGVGEAMLQKNIDYACGAGADCTPILQNGQCFNPNTIQDHCNWAVNSYYQKKAQMTGSCDFAGTAIVSTTPPSQSSSCVYPASPSFWIQLILDYAVGLFSFSQQPVSPKDSPEFSFHHCDTGTPTTNPGTPTTVNPPPGTPGTGTGTGTGTGGTNTGGNIIPGTSGGFPLAPTGSSYGGTDIPSSGMTLQQTSNLAIAISLVYFVIMVDAYNNVLLIM